MGTERRAATRTMRCYFIALIDKSFVPHLFDRPPDRLDVAVVHGDISMLQVHPVGDSLGEVIPFFQVSKTLSRHLALNRSTPYASICALPEIPVASLPPVQPVNREYPSRRCAACKNLSLPCNGG